jgi:hypothetical protein
MVALASRGHEVEEGLVIQRNGTVSEDALERLGVLPGVTNTLREIAEHISERER